MEFLPRLSDQQLPQFYHDIDVFAHSRKDGETVGIAIAEAMMAGNPIITHKSRFHNEHLNLLETSFAKWCKADDVEGYFLNMAWFVDHADQIREMGQLARKKALSIFGMDVQLPAIVKVMYEACESCTHYSPRGRIKGYLRLYWENVKAMPFYLVKKLSYAFPFIEEGARKIYRRNH